MCGRFTLHTEKELLARRYEVDLEGIDLTPRYNIAPARPCSPCGRIKRDAARGC